VPSLFIDYAEAGNKHTDIQNMIKAVNIKRQHDFTTLTPLHLPYPLKLSSSKFTRLE